MAVGKGLESIVAELPVFRGLDSRYVELVAGCASNVRFDEGAYVFREGEPADAFYAIRHGRVAVEIFVPQRGAVTIMTASEGDVLNWSWLFPPHRNQLVRALAFDAKCLRGKCEEDHDLGYQFMKRFAKMMVERVRATRLQLLDIYGSAGES